MDRATRIGARLLCAVLLWCGAGAVHAASISGPTTSSNGTFQLTWTSGWHLWLDDVSWRVASSGTSWDFDDLPSGTYKFRLASCFWTYVGGTSYRYDCSFHATAKHTVTVTRDAAPVIDTSTTEAGSTAYSAQVSLRGSSRISVPLATLPGVNGLAPALRLEYDSARVADGQVNIVDDTLGYGWSLEGVSMIHRCRGGLADSATPLALTTTDLLCLDGTPLSLVSGTYWGTTAEYRTAINEGVRITRVGDGFQVQYPDGSVGLFGDTAATRVVASGWWTPTATGPYGDSSYAIKPSPVYFWGLRQLTHALGNVMTVTYEKFDGYGVLRPKSIQYGANEVQFKYGPRNDLAPKPMVTSGPHVKETGVLNRVIITSAQAPVREYRLSSTAQAQYSGALALVQIQECGYEAAGGTVRCLRPLDLAWTWGLDESDPVMMSEISDGLGAKTQFFYDWISLEFGNPLVYPELAFGALLNVPNATPREYHLAVAEMRQSDGLGSSGFRRWTYRYKGWPLRNTQNRGFIGFYEVRAKDEQSGVVTYTQTRLDWPFIGHVSHVRSFNNTFGAHTQELARIEQGYAIQSQAGGSVYSFEQRTTQWQFEGGVLVGGLKANTSLCFRLVMGFTCPTTGTIQEFPTQQTTVVQEGTTISNPSFTPAFWGDVPNRTIGTVGRTVTSVDNFMNTSSPWVREAVALRSVTHNVPGQSERTIIHHYTYKAGTRELEISARQPGHGTLALTVTRAFDGANQNVIASSTVSGVGISARTTNFGTPYFDGLYPASVTNPLGHQTVLTPDFRFGQPAEVTDPNGRTTDVEYDPFGRVVRRTDPDGAETTVEYERCDVVGCYDVVNAEAALKVTTQVLNGTTQTAPTRVTYLDVLGREVLSEEEALRASDGWRRVRTEYDNRSRVKYVSRPYFSTQATPTCTAAGANCTWFTYDLRDRVTREDRPDGGFTTTAFTGAAGSVTVTVTETVKRPGAADETRAKRSVFNVLGQLTSTIDAFGSAIPVTTAYTYDAHGNLATVSVAGVNVATMQYDLVGNRTQIVEPNTGTTNFVYNTLGELTQATDAKGQVIAFTYDDLGRLTGRTDHTDGNNTWTWDAAEIGALTSRSRPGFTETYGYRSSDGQLETVTTDISVSAIWTETFTRTLNYDAAGRVGSQEYPNGQVMSYTYSDRGYLTQVRNGSTVLHDWIATDAFGNATEERFHGNAFRTFKAYDTGMGRLTSIQTGTTATPKSIQDLEYVWRSNSSLYRRIDRRNGAGTAYTDTFSYDALERVTQQATTGGASRTLSFTYDLHGNITTKTSNVSGDQNASGYTYNVTGKPHRLASVSIGGVSNTLTYDNNGNTTRYTPASGHSTYLKYDAQNNVTQITRGASEETVAPEARDRFWYDPDNQRFLGQETWDDGGTQRMRRVVYLGGDYEDVLPEDGNTYSRIQRIQATSTAQQIRRRLASTGVWQTPIFEYVHRDHLGSVDAITNSAGVVQAKFSFDPFGGRRATTWGADLDATGIAALRAFQSERGSRGFTGHEHLNRTGFIHMNGRVYDPRIGRFVSPDPVIPNPAFSQSYNRYAYVHNNPLSYTDPSGFILKKAWKGIKKAFKNAFKKVTGILKDPMKLIETIIHIAIWVEGGWLGNIVLSSVVASAGATARHKTSQARARAQRRAGVGEGGGTPGFAGPMFSLAAGGNAEPLEARQAAARAEIDQLITLGVLVLPRSNKSRDELAREVLSILHPISVRHRVEIGAWIFEDGAGGYVIRSVHVGDDSTVPELNRGRTPAGARGAIHTHPEDDATFSDRDLRWVYNRQGDGRPQGVRLPLYVSGGGRVYVCDPAHLLSCNWRFEGFWSDDNRHRRGRSVGDVR